MTYHYANGKTIIYLGGRDEGHQQHDADLFAKVSQPHEKFVSHIQLHDSKMKRI